MSNQKEAYPTALADRLRREIERSGQNLNQLAGACGVAQPVLYRFMTGERGLTLETVERLAAHFGLRFVKGRK